MPHSHLDPQIRELIASAGAYLRGEQVNKAAALATLRPGQIQSPSAGQLQAVYETACHLCDEGNFAFASGLALHLVAHAPKDARFTFIAGTCLQRMGVFANAAQMFGFSLVHGGDHPATLYRFGECLLALGDRENAAKALEAAFDLSRGREEARVLQAMSEKLIETLQRDSRGARAFASLPGSN